MGVWIDLKVDKGIKFIQFVLGVVIFFGLILYNVDLGVMEDVEVFFVFFDVEDVVDICWYYLVIDFFNWLCLSFDFGSGKVVGLMLFG